MNKIYYWANDTKKNSGEGILAINFLSLLKKKFKYHKLINLNTFKKKNNLFYNYILLFWGIILIWKYYSKGYKVSYINYLPIWNILIFLSLPRDTILGPITGTITKKNILYKFFCLLGAFILKRRKKKLLFSHSQLKLYFPSNKKNYFNFLFYKFKIKTGTTKKKFKIIFYFKDNNNKGNYFLINILKNISEKHKIAVIGDDLSKFLNKKNITNFGTLNRNQAIKIIKSANFALTSKENHFSFFALDCLSRGLKVFYNKDLKISNDIKTNMFIPIDFANLKNSTDAIQKILCKKRDKINILKLKLKNFDNYLTN